ncbi:MAG TPA: flagellar basal body rod protein FlgB [Candidatus Sulfotelmatobacter sp.]
MIDSNNTERLSRSLDVNVARYRLITNNLANVETPGYRTRDLDFRGELRRATLPEANSQGGVLYASFAAVARPVRGLLERPDGNNVSLERESLLMAETQMRYNLGIQLLKDEFHGISAAINSGGSAS